MAAETNTLRLEIKVGTDGLVQGLKIASSGVDEAAQSIRTSFAGIGSHAREIGAPLESVTEHIRGMRQEMFLGNFMARQIGELGIASRESAGMVAGLAGAFLVGNWTGLAIEGVLKLTGVLNDMANESKKAAVEAIKAIGDLHDKVEEYLASLRKETEVEKLRRTQLAPLEQKEAAQKRQLVDLTDALAVREAALRKSRASGVDLMSEKGRVELLKQQIEEKEKLLGLTEIEVNAAKQALDEAARAKVDADKKDAHDKAIDDAKKAQDEFNQYKQKTYETDLANWKKHLQDMRDAQLKELVEQAQSTKQEATEEGAIRKAVLDFENERLDAALKAKLAADEAALRSAKQRAREELTAAREIGQAFGETFGGIVSGTKSVGAAIADMAKLAIKALIDMAIKAVQANALNAGAGAAASQASVPIIGPALAIAAMAAMEGAVLALLSSMPSARGGFDIPSGVNPITQLHEREMVLPAQHADVIRGLRGKTSVADNQPIIIQALDSKSFEDALRRNSTSLVRVTKELTRNRRL